MLFHSIWDRSLDSMILTDAHLISRNRKEMRDGEYE